MPRLRTRPPRRQAAARPPLRPRSLRLLVERRAQVGVPSEHTADQAGALRARALRLAQQDMPHMRPSWRRAMSTSGARLRGKRAACLRSPRPPRRSRSSGWRWLRRRRRRCAVMLLREWYSPRPRRRRRSGRRDQRGRRPDSRAGASRRTTRSEGPSIRDRPPTATATRTDPPLRASPDLAAHFGGVVAAQVRDGAAEAV